MSAKEKKTPSYLYDDDAFCNFAMVTSNLFASKQFQELSYAARMFYLVCAAHKQTPEQSTYYNIFMVIVPDSQSGLYPSRCLNCYNDGAIGISESSLDQASVKQTDNQLLIRSVRFMQVEPPLRCVRVTPQ